MTNPSMAAWRIAAASGAILGAMLFLLPASAQFSPPSTVFGSISDSGGTVEKGLPVEAYIGDKLCGTKGFTDFTGDGDARITYYVVDVVHESQIEGCGRAGANQQVRIKIGDRFADKTAIWDPGAVRLDVTFGNATPVPIPTFTPAPTRTPDPAGTARPAGTAGAAGEVATIPPGSPGAGSPVPTSPQGGITNVTPGQLNAAAGDDDDGGVPVWAIVLLVLGGIGAVGGGVGYVMARNNRATAPDDDLFPPMDP